VPIAGVGCGDFDPGRGDRYLNGGAFRDPVPWAFGNAGRVLGNVRTCANFNENISILKAFPIKEKVRIQIGADFFNTFNRHNWGAPNTDIDNVAGFGTISSTSPGRVIQVHGRVEW
jgi:hypothetical protein